MVGEVSAGFQVAGSGVGFCGSDLCGGSVPDFDSGGAGGETPPERPGVRLASHVGKMRVGREETAGVVAARCGIPLGTLTADEGERLKRLEELLSGRVKGQPGAIAAVADAVRLARAGLKKPERQAGVSDRGRDCGG